MLKVYFYKFLSLFFGDIKYKITLPEGKRYKNKFGEDYFWSSEKKFKKVTFKTSTNKTKLFINIFNPTVLSVVVFETISGDVVLVDFKLCFGFSEAEIYQTYNCVYFAKIDLSRLYHPNEFYLFLEKELGIESSDSVTSILEL